MLQRLEKEEVQVGQFRSIPEGAYKINILGAKVENYTNGGEGIKIQFDVSEGEYKGFFKEQYENSTFDNKTYKGVITIFVPQENNQYFEQNNKRFWRNITAIEDLNNNFKFTDLQQVPQLKGKKAIILMANKKWEYQGKEGIGVQPQSFIYKEDFENGAYKDTLEYINSKLQKPQSTAQSQVNDFEAIDISSDDLPF